MLIAKLNAYGFEYSVLALLNSYLSGRKQRTKIGNEIISNCQEVKLLGITFNNSLSFDIHVEKLCKKAYQKLHALARLSNYMNQE